MALGATYKDALLKWQGAIKLDRGYVLTEIGKVQDSLPHCLIEQCDSVAAKRSV